MKSAPGRCGPEAQEDRREPIHNIDSVRVADLPTQPQRLLGPPCAEYTAMQEIFRRRAEQLELSRQTIDKLANFTPGLASKILAPTPIKRLGYEHLGPLCAALAVAWLPIEDAQSLAEIELRISRGDVEKSNPNLAKHAGTVQFKFSRRHMREIQKKGGQNSRKYISKKRASKIGRKAARKRWYGAHAARGGK
jgi:hypothetical protein